MSKLNKQFEYKNYKFNTSVELNTREEKRIGGKKYHTVITNCLGGNNFYINEYIESPELISCIDSHYKRAVMYIDELTNENPKSNEEILLIELGFS